MALTSETTVFDPKILESIFRTSKKTIQEYVAEIERHCRFKSVQRYAVTGTVLDDRSRLIDIYEACVQQDAHLAGVLETLESQIVGERYMLAKQNDKGRYVKDIEESKKIQGTQFTKIIRGIVEAKLYGYTGFEILPDTDHRTGRLSHVEVIERRNILADQHRIVQRQGIWLPGWDFDAPKYRDNYILINTDGIGLFSAVAPWILAKKFTTANYVNFSHTYGQPIIHGKTVGESLQDRQMMAHEIASAAQNKVIVTGVDDTIDIKTFTMSNSEKIFTGLMEKANQEVSNLILGSESMAGATQSYVGSTQAHQDIFRDRIKVWRTYIENVMNEEIIPRLVLMGFLKPGNEFKYSNRLEMSTDEQIKLFQMVTERYEVDAEEVDKTFGIVVGKQLNTLGGGIGGDSIDVGTGDRPVGTRRMSDEEYYRRYGHERGVTNFLKERR